MIRVLDEEKINRMIDALLALQEREDVTIPVLRRQFIETEKGIENLVNAIQQGILTASTKQRLEELEKQKEELSLSIARAELQKPKLTREYMEHWFSQFRSGSPDDRTFPKRLIDTFVHAVYVYDDKLVLTYNYQHGTQTVTRKEVEAFLSSDLAEMSPPKWKSLWFLPRRFPRLTTERPQTDFCFDHRKGIPCLKGMPFLLVYSPAKSEGCLRWFFWFQGV